MNMYEPLKFMIKFEFSGTTGEILFFFAPRVSKTIAEIAGKIAENAVTIAEIPGITFDNFWLHIWGAFSSPIS